MQRTHPELVFCMLLPANDQNSKVVFFLPMLGSHEYSTFFVVPNGQNCKAV